MIEFNIFFLYDWNMKIVVACSGGPDSMALLDMLRKSGKDIVVAHINYQKRDTAIRDENIVRSYCSMYDIPLHIDKPILEGKENFQAWARNVRYQFFEMICDQYNTKEIYVAHQKDDVIETYIFQKRRHMICDAYGIQEKSIRNGYTILRPLLMYTKQDLINYCIENHVSFGIDETNLEDHYTRNQIRHSFIDSLTLDQKNAICEEIKEENEKLKIVRDEISVFLKDFNVDSLLEKEMNWLYLDTFLSNYLNSHLSKKYLMDLCEKMRKDCLIDLGEYELERFHNTLTCTKKKSVVYDIYESIEYVQKDDYALKRDGKTIEGITLYESDFPICVRTVQEKDEIHLRFGTKRVHRFFVDRKIPKHIRKYWLVVQNCEKKIIFVPEIGCDVEHFSIKPNAFMIKYEL